MTEPENSQESAPPDSKLEEFEQKIDRLAESMATQTNQVLKSARIILSVGIVLAIVVAVYLGVLFNAYVDMIEPEALAETASGVALGALPTMQETLETSLRDAAPGMVKQAKDTLIENIPKIREALEDKMDVVADGMIDKLDEALDPMVDEVLKGSKEDIEEMLKDLDDEEMAIQLGMKLKDELAKQFAEQVDTDLDEFLVAMEAIEKKLVLLHTKKELSPEEAFEKELITTWAIFLSQSMKESLEKPLEGETKAGEPEAAKAEPAEPAEAKPAAPPTKEKPKETPAAAKVEEKPEVAPAAKPAKGADTKAPVRSVSVR